TNAAWTSCWKRFSATAGILSPMKRTASSSASPIGIATGRSSVFSFQCSVFNSAMNLPCVRVQGCPEGVNALHFIQIARELSSQDLATGKSWWDRFPTGETVDIPVHPLENARAIAGLLLVNGIVGRAEWVECRGGLSEHVEPILPPPAPPPSSHLPRLVCP